MHSIESDLSVSEYKGELAKFIDEQMSGRENCYAVTVGFTYPTHHLRARERIRKLWARLDYKLLGSQWSKKTLDRRLNGILIPEWGGLAGKRHYHGMIRSASSRHSLLMDAWGAEWEYLESSGTSDVKAVYDYPGWRHYMLKNLTRQAINEYLVLPIHK